VCGKKGKMKKGKNKAGRNKEWSNIKGDISARKENK
jgi:hypothetical protein